MQTEKHRIVKITSKDLIRLSMLSLCVQELYQSIERMSSSLILEAGIIVMANTNISSYPVMALVKNVALFLYCLTDHCQSFGSSRGERQTETSRVNHLFHCCCRIYQDVHQISSERQSCVFLFYWKNRELQRVIVQGIF